ncbi:MAG: class I SAM-dependent methyltransferase [Gammaproteobacteria bacterium]|nr:class I SAM-dependent methyltransferase [Gammaproteobacteria bacterium]
MRLLEADFSDSFDTNENDIHDKCGDLIKYYDLSYTNVIGQQRNDLILKILKRIETDTQRIAEPARKDIWQEGWQENLDAFITSGNDLSMLVPKFIRSEQPVRFKQKYIMPNAPEFELKFFDVFRHWLFKTYFFGVDNVYEFGCGTGFNLVTLAKLFPSIKLYGLDFVQSSCDLVTKIAEKYELNLESYLFDMITPDEQFTLDKNSAVFTIGAIEQLGGQFHAFIGYLMENKPKIVLHCEPVLELYDLDVLEDYLAYKFQKKRGYTIGLLPYLMELEKHRCIKIEKIKRLYFGSLLMEGYNLIVWRPL